MTASNTIIKFTRAEEERAVELINRCVRACQLKQVHARVVSAGLAQNNFVVAKLVRAFAELGNLEHARAVFDAVSNPNAFVWTALIRGYSSCSREWSIELYARMQRTSDIKPLNFTVCSVLKACGNASAGFRQGVQVHAHAFKYGFQFDARVQTTLVDLYSKCGKQVEARQVFDKMSKTTGIKDIQLWNTMIAGYAEAGDMDAARSLFERMQDRNTFTWVKMIAGYVKCNQMDSASRLFNVQVALKNEPVVCTAMITGYAKSGDLLAARSVFDEMGRRDVATWNAMITAYSNAGLNDEALDLFRLMISTNVDPNRTTIASIVSVCAQSGSPKLARWIQDYVDRHGSELLNSHTVAALIDLHSKCGDLRSASDLFSRWTDKDLVCYSSMIAGFGIHGCGKDATRVFDELIQSGLKPDSICLVSVLTACSHAGMVDEGRQYFESMRNQYGVPPTTEHYICLVDLLGRAGRIDEAYRLVTEEMPVEFRRHAGLWGALLSACRTHSNVEVGEQAMRQLMELEPENTGNYVLMSNIYAKARRWDGVVRMRVMMRGRGMRKPPGCSWVEGEGGGVTKFLTTEAYDCRLDAVLEVLSWELRNQGYVPSIIEEV